MPKVPATPAPKTIEQKVNEHIPSLPGKKLPSPGIAALKLREAKTPKQIAEAKAEAVEVLKENGVRIGDDSNGIETIRQYSQDLEDLARKEKAAIEVLEKIEQGWDETKEVERLEDEIDKARQKLKSRRLTNTSYLAQTEKVAKVRRDKAEAREILSRYLVFHYRKTGEEQVLVDEENGDARQVVMKAKLGRLVKYQTSMDLSGEEN